MILIIVGRDYGALGFAKVASGLKPGAAVDGKWSPVAAKSSWCELRPCADALCMPQIIGQTERLNRVLDGKP